MNKVIVVGTYDCTIRAKGKTYTSFAEHAFVLHVPDDIIQTTDDAYDAYLARHFELCVKELISDTVRYDSVDVSITCISDYNYREV